MDITHVIMHDMGQSSATQRFAVCESWKGIVQNVNTSREGGHGEGQALALRKEAGEHGEGQALALR